MIPGRSNPLHLSDPCPQLLRDLRGDATNRVRILEIPVQDVPRWAFKTLAAGNVAFVDSTHVARIGSAVLRAFEDPAPAPPDIGSYPRYGLTFVATMDCR
jgi:hypothetical protein